MANSEFWHSTGQTILCSSFEIQGLHLHYAKRVKNCLSNKANTNLLTLSIISPSLHWKTLPESTLADLHVVSDDVLVVQFELNRITRFELKNEYIEYKVINVYTSRRFILTVSYFICKTKETAIENINRLQARRDCRRIERIVIQIVTCLFWAYDVNGRQRYRSKIQHGGRSCSCPLGNLFKISVASLPGKYVLSTCSNLQWYLLNCCALFCRLLLTNSSLIMIHRVLLMKVEFERLDGATLYFNRFLEVLASGTLHISWK